MEPAYWVGIVVIGGAVYLIYNVLKKKRNKVRGTSKSSGRSIKPKKGDKR